VTVHRAGSNRYVARERIGGVFTDGRDLIVTDSATNELLRVNTDKVLVDRLRDAFERFDYPWQGTRDPHDHAFATWVDGSGLLDARTHDLLRARQRALADKRPGAAEDARDELRNLGIAVRDRQPAQGLSCASPEFPMRGLNGCQYGPIAACTRSIRSPTAPVSYHCARLVVVRDGSAILTSEFGEKPVRVGDVIALAPDTP